MSNNTPSDLEVDEPIAPESAPEPDKLEPEQVVPDKYKGKSVFDLIEMHSNSEKKISEQGRELGDLRKATDELLGLRKENVKPKTPVTAEEIFSDPDAAVTRAIEQSDAAQRATRAAEKVEALERSIGQKEFEGRYPDFIQDVQNPEFQSWVQNNRARAGLLVELNNNYNFEAGTALWEMWDEFKSAPKAAAKKRATIKDASTVRNSPDSGVRKPIYSRTKLADLQLRASRGDAVAKLRWNDPVFQKEYQEAYAEGRVK
jgi:hypothetical protein